MQCAAYKVRVQGAGCRRVELKRLVSGWLGEGEGEGVGVGVGVSRGATTVDHPTHPSLIIRVVNNPPSVGARC